MNRVLATLIILVAAICLIVGVGMVVSEGYGGSLPGLLALAGELLLAAANILVLLLNLLYWKLYGAPRWLRVIIGLQMVPAVVTVALAGRQGYDNWRQDRAYGQRQRLEQAIETDRADDLVPRQRQCGTRCSRLYPLNAQLLDAADANAVAVAQKLVQEGAVVSSGLGQAARTLRTCEGTPLFDLNALAVAVARNNPGMVKVLLPVSDASARKRAMRIAAKLDRPALAQALAAKDGKVPSGPPERAATPSHGGGAPTPCIGP